MADYKNYITVDSQICHGQPCFKGTRVLVYLVLELLEAGETPESITKNAYPQLSIKHVQAAIHYAVEVIKSSEFIPFTNPA